MGPEPRTALTVVVFVPFLHLVKDCYPGVTIN